MRDIKAMQRRNRTVIGLLQAADGHEVSQAIMQCEFLRLRCQLIGKFGVRCRQIHF